MRETYNPVSNVMDAVVTKVTDLIDDVDSGATKVKGNLLVADGTKYKSLGVGANGKMLVADSAQAMGVKWADALTVDLTLSGKALLFTPTASIPSSSIGMGATGVNILDLWTNGISAIQISAVQNVGIGGAPRSVGSLHVKRSGGVQPILILETTDNTNNPAFYFSSQGDLDWAIYRSIGNNRMIFLMDGWAALTFKPDLRSVGFGTDNPAATFHIVKNTAGQAGLIIASYPPAVNPYLAFGLSGNISHQIWRNTTTGDFNFALSGVKMFISTSGKVTTNYGMHINDWATDSDTYIKGDTATKLLVCDAGLDAVQIGTTVAGAIADFRAASITLKQPVKISNLAGTGTRNVVADVNGNLSAP